jgi:hypothetical protein
MRESPTRSRIEFERFEIPPIPLPPLRVSPLQSPCITLEVDCYPLAPCSNTYRLMIPQPSFRSYSILANVRPAAFISRRSRVWRSALRADQAATAAGQ